MDHLRTKFGNDGYVVWYILLEELAKTKQHFIKLDQEARMFYLANICKIEKITLLEIIQELVNLEEFDNELWNEHKVLYNQKFIDSVRMLYRKRKSTPITRKDVVAAILPEPSAVLPENSRKVPHKGKERKVKESKVKEIKVKKGKTPLPGGSYVPACRQAFEKFYKAFTKENYYWKAADSKNMQGLARQIAVKYEEKNNVPATEEMVAKSLLQMLNNLPKWYQDHLSVPTLNSKFNEIFQQIIKKTPHGSIDKEEFNQWASEVSGTQ